METFKQNILVDSSMVDTKLRLKYSSLLKIFQDISTNATESLGFGKKLTIDRGFFWVIIRCHIEIYELPSFLDNVEVCSYPGIRKMFLYPRHYEIKSESGKTLIKAVYLWTIIDESSRKIASIKDTGIDYQGFEKNMELPFPTSIKKIQEIEFLDRRKTYHSDMDLNQHLNNIRLLDFVYDTYFMDADRDIKIKEIKIDYLKEGKDVDFIDIYKTKLSSDEDIFELKKDNDILTRYEIKYI